MLILDIRYDDWLRVSTEDSLLHLGRYGSYQMGELYKMMTIGFDVDIVLSERYLDDGDRHL